MQFDPQRPQLRHGGTPGSRAQAIVVRVLTAVAAAVALVGAIAMSIVVFAIALTALFVLGLYFWWKLRQLRRRTISQPAHDDVIEGVVVRKESTRE
jgi:Flp pilus assembly protein TadB